MTPTFASLGVAEDLVEALAARGITEPFPIQALSIPPALEGRDVCGKAKTGSGKTLAFGLPLLGRVAKAEPRRPRALVLVPTRELALQVCDELKPLSVEREVCVTAVYGGAPMEKQVAALQKGAEVVAATPGRLIDLIDRNECSVADVEAVVLDEADRMADMGFLPQVEWILRRIEREHQTLLFSATLDGVVNGVIKRHTKDPVVCEVESRQVTVDEMHHRFLHVHDMDKVRVAAAIARGTERTLIFCNTKRGTDRLERSLGKEGVDAAAIHGDLPQRVRERALKDFDEGRLHVLVATDVAARGIHVDDIDVVIHYDPPSDHKAYLHRSGRTARAGESGVVVSLVLWNQELEVKRLQNRIGVDQPIVEVFSNDPRLSDLLAWDPAEELAASA
jgi:superfamily II DNA/RNA helicase